VSIAIPNDTLARIERLSFVTRRPARAGLGGEHRSRQRAPSTDFVEYRAYRPGDDFRRIDWNVYGRLGSLQVRVTEGRERLDLVLGLDNSASMAWGEPDKLAFASTLAAALAYVGLGRFEAVRVASLSDGPSFGPVRGRRRFSDVLGYLDALTPRGRLDIARASQDSLGAGREPPLVVLISDLLTPEGIDQALDGLLRQGSDVVVLHVLSPQELKPELLGELELVDAETSQRLEVGLSVAALDAYRQRFAEWLERQAQACVQRGLRYLQMRTDRPLSAVLLDDLRTAEVLA
jgi:uncharacterized protein (DUF58 family)